MASFIADRMLDLWGGRMDAYGLDMPDGGGAAVRQPVTTRLVDEHLDGTAGIGIYPMWKMDGDWWVKWGCCDIDTGDWMEAYALARTLQAMGFYPFIERSRSKGWHVWVFASKPVKARTMRRALKVAYATIGLPAKEANPKAETLLDHQLGNYVRLPYKGQGKVLGNRQVIMQNWDAVGDGEPISVVTFLANFDELYRVPPMTVEHWASKWREPERPKLELSLDDTVDLADIQGPMRTLIENPPDDRSGGLVRLAGMAAKLGWNPAEIYTLLVKVDALWGKYTGRMDAEGYYQDIVERVVV